MIKETTKYISDYRYRDRNGNDLTDDETIVFLDLSKIESVLDKNIDEMTSVEMWAIFFKYVTDESKQSMFNQILESEERIKMAKNILTEVSKDEEARAYYESQLIFELDQRGRINHAKDETKIEIAKNAIQENLPVELISKLTELDITMIKDLQKQYEGKETSNNPFRS